MEIQIIVDILLGIIIVLMGFVLNGAKSDMSEMRKNHKELEDRLFSMGIKIPATYVTKEELYRMLDNINNTLEQINHKLDKKSDKE